MTNSLVLVTGATGAVGPALVSHLIEQGYRVRTLTRTQPETGLLPSAADTFIGDITDTQAVTDAIQGVEIVFHLAAKLHIENPTPELEKDYERVNVEGTRSLVSAAVEQGVKRFIYFSTVKVYGEKASTPISETQVPAPETMYAQSKLAGEQLVQAAAIDSVILRLSAVYGARLRGSWARLASAIRRGIYLPIGDLNNQRSVTYVDDVAFAAQIAAEHPDAVGQVFNVVGHEALTMREIYQAIYDAYGRSMPAFTLPAAPLIAGVDIADKMLGIVGRSAPINADSLRQLITDELYSGAALKALGFVPQTTLIEGWQQIASAQQEEQ